MKIHRQLKRAVAAMLGSPVARPLFKPLLKDRFCIFMLHRFGSGRDRHTPEVLERALATLVRYDIPVHRLHDAIGRFVEGEDVEGVAFTVDDGYHDFATIAAPVFHRFQCPVTVFLTTGFVDGNFWFWWDRLEVALESTKVGTLWLPGAEDRALPLSSSSDRYRVRGEVIGKVKDLPQHDRASFLADIFERLKVVLPEDAPQEFRPMTWTQVQQLAAEGVDFAPHSVTHPSMATMQPRKVTAEAAESFSRLTEVLEDPAPVFCYPYGLSGDVSVEAARAVKEAGLLGAVTAIRGYVHRSTVDDPFLLPRFGFPGSLVDFRQFVFGADRFKEMVRNHLRR